MTKKAKAKEKAGDVRVEWMRIDEIPFHPDNPKTHDLKQIRASIRRYGFRSPVVLSPSGVSSEGEGRTLSLLGMHADGEDAPEGIRGPGGRAPKKGGVWLAPVLVGLPPFKSADDERDFLFVSNRLVELGGYKAETVQRLMQAARKQGRPAFGGLALRAEQLTRALRRKNAEETAIPDKPKKAITKPGDLWTLGDHRILCGDATKRDAVGALVAELGGKQKPDLLWEDPPYGVAHGKGVTKAKKIKGDITQAVIPLAFAVVLEHLSDDARIYICGGSENVGLYLGLFDHHMGRHPRLLIWAKDSFVLRQHGYHSQYELIFHTWKGNGGAIWYGDRKQSDVWSVPRGSKATEHPNEKPVELPARALRDVTEAGAVLVDRFLGSGSSLIACEQLERRALTMDLDPGWIDVTIERWEQLTGGKATRRKGAL